MRWTMMLLLAGLIMAIYGQEYGRAEYSTATYEEEGPSVPQMMNWMDIDYDALEEVVERKDQTNGDQKARTWSEEVLEAVRSKIIPEMCNQTAKSCNLYNSFLLDCHCVEMFDSMSDRCRGLKCDLTQHLASHGPRILYDFMHAESIIEGVEVIHRELKLIFTNTDLCRCGKELTKSFMKCARFYHANVIMASMDCYDIRPFQTYLRNIDLDALGVVVEKLIGGMCDKSKKKDSMCLDAVFKGLKEVAGMVGGTIEDYSMWEEGTDKERKKMEGRCDRLFGPIQAFIDADNHELYVDYNATNEDYWTTALEQTSAFMNNLYCKWPCKKDRSSLFPCCMKRMLNDEALYTNLERFLLSVIRLPLVDNDYWGDFAQLEPFAQEMVDKALKFTMPRNMIDLFKKTINAGNYCQGRNLRCTN